MTTPDVPGAPGPGAHEPGSGDGAGPGPQETGPAGTEQEETLESLFGLTAPPVRPPRGAPG